ncbi:unnamed protein product [Paramecium sonneborni]|uniref:Uncharacterized protein n=1 Tax=Paramecium sonneborni TaxID=65129 RepID=A0A8S1QN55_9CILI|nr:unnamed protein product [Paramecium sonneborni]
MLGFLNKGKVRDIEVDSQIIEGKLPIIVFSYGLGGLKDHYSVIYKELAINVYVIHQYKVEEASLENALGQQILNKVKMIKHQQLNDRVNKFQLSFVYVYQQKNINLNKIIGAGHSFGAAIIKELPQTLYYLIDDFTILRRHFQYLINMKHLDLEKKMKLCKDTVLFLMHNNQNQLL